MPGGPTVLLGEPHPNQSPIEGGQKLITPGITDRGSNLGPFAHKPNAVPLSHPGRL